MPTPYKYSADMDQQNARAAELMGEEEREAPPAPYDCGERVDHALDDLKPDCLLKVFYQRPHCDTPEASAAEIEACAHADELQKTLDATVNAGRREISSVLSTGRYHAIAHAGHPPAHFPETRPYYE